MFPFINPKSYFINLSIIALLFFVWCDYASAFTITTPTKNKVGLVGHWTFDGQDMLTGTVRDVSGNNNHGSMVNMATATSRTKGKVGQALQFDGSNDYIVLPDATAFSPETGTITMAGWFKSNELSTDTYTMVSNRGSVTNNLMYIYSDGNRPACYIRDGSSNYIGLTDYGLSSVKDNGEWHFVACVKDSQTTAKLYVISRTDGTFIRAGTNNSMGAVTLSGGHAPYIGSVDTSLYFWKGSLDDVRIYNRALSPSEIQALYKMGEGTKTATTPSAGRGQAPSGCKSGLSCGLVGHWTFDGQDMLTGTVRDVSGNNNHGSMVNMATATSRTKGKVGQGLAFDGANDCVDAGLSSSLNITGAVTVSAWVKMRSSALNRSIASKSSVGGGAITQQYHLVDSGSNRLSFSVKNASQPSNLGVLLDVADVLSYGKWYHIVGMYNGTDTVTIYKDGQLKKTGTTADYGPMQESGKNFNIGGSHGSTVCNGGYFDGEIDDVRVYNRVLSASEIQALYKMGEGTKTATTPSAGRGQAPSGCTSGLSCGFVGHWTFDGQDMLTGTVRDVSGNNNHGSMVNMATATSRTKGKVGQALKFDGTDDYIKVTNSSSLTNYSKKSVFMWIYPTADVSKDIFSNGYWISPFGDLFQKLTNAGRSQIYLKNNAGTTAASAHLSTPLNQWTHIGYTWDGTTVNYYLNGQIADTPDSFTGTLSGTGANVFIGGRVTTNFFPGTIDDVRIYNRALSAQEIQQLYNMGR